MLNCSCWKYLGIGTSSSAFGAIWGMEGQETETIWPIHYYFQLLTQTPVLFSSSLEPRRGRFVIPLSPALTVWPELNPRG